jgi:ABC-2 type transport system ATP-binding protein
MKNFAIEANNLTKTFAGGVVAVSGLDLHVERGAVYGLMGRNGAGKTTTLRLLMGLLQPDQGAARLLGKDLSSAPHALRARVAYVSQAQQLPGWMTLAELCRYVSHFYDQWNEKLAADIARRWALPKNRPIGQLSGGEQRKVAILLALSPQPEVLLLDEPAAGLDAMARRELVDELISLISRGDGCTVLFSTHIISDLERIAEVIGIMDRGRLLISAQLDELQSSMRRIQIIFPGDSPPRNFTLPGSLRCETSGAVFTAIARLPDTQHLDSLRRLPGVRVQVFPLGLEDIFIEMLERERMGESNAVERNGSTQADALA